MKNNTYQPKQQTALISDTLVRIGNGNILEVERGVFEKLTLKKSDVGSTLDALRRDYFYKHFVEWVNLDKIKHEK